MICLLRSLPPSWSKPATVFRKSWTSGVSKIFTVMVVVSSSLSLCPALRQGECKAMVWVALVATSTGCREDSGPRRKSQPISNGYPAIPLGYRRGLPNLALPRPEWRQKVHDFPVNYPREPRARRRRAAAALRRGRHGRWRDGLKSRDWRRSGSTGAGRSHAPSTLRRREGATKA